MITLERLGREDIARVAHIAVLPVQEPFCGSIRGHFEKHEPFCDFHAVMRDGHAVGFFKIDRDFAASHSFAHPGELGLRGMMIDAGEQGRGTGKAAMQALAPYLAAEYPTAPLVVLTVNIMNAAARSIYLAGGFHDMGELYYGGRLGPQHILRLRLRARVAISGVA